MELIDILNNIVAPIVLFVFFIYLAIISYREFKKQEKRDEEMYKKQSELLDLQLSNERLKKVIILEVANVLQES